MDPVLDTADEGSEPTKRRRVLALIGSAVVAAIVLVIVLSRCGADEAVPDTVPEEVDIYAGALKGMTGTRPHETIDEEWRTALNDFWLSQDELPLEGYQYAAESYDSVVIAALAAEAAGTDGSALAGEIVELTRDGTKCESFVECRDLLRDGEDVDYDGKSGKFTMNDRGEVVETNFSVVEFGADNRIDDALTQYREIIGSREGEALEASEVTRAGDGVLKIGSILPLTGQLAIYGPPQFAGLEFAISEINSVGGVLGAPIEYLKGDCGDSSSNKAESTVDEMIAQNVDVAIGPSSTIVTAGVIDRILGAGIVQISPANTNMTLVDYEDGGLYFRAAPADDQQSYLLAEVIAADGVKSVAIAAVEDLYGTSIAEVLEAELIKRDIEVVTSLYNPALADFDPLVTELKDTGSDAIVLIGFEEVARILRRMVEQGVGPLDLEVYGIDAIMGNGLGENFDVSA